MKKEIIFISMAVISAACKAQQPFSYDYFEVGGWEKSNGDTTGEGSEAAWSIDANKGAFFRISYAEGEVKEIENISLSAYGLDIDYQSIGLFVGGHSDKRRRLNIWSGLSYNHDEYKVSMSSLNADVNGFTIKFGSGLRYWLLPSLEINGGLEYHYTDISDLNVSDSDGLLSAGIRYHPVPALSIGIKAGKLFSAETENIGASIRIQF